MRAVVTGSSRGLGLALVTLYAERGHDVIAVCRTPTPDLEALGVDVLEDVDIARDDATTRLREALRDVSVDVLVCNAGINATFASGIDDLDVAALRGEFEVDTFGAMRTVQGVLPSMAAGGKIALISTWRPGVGAARRNYGYQMSKVALNQMGFLLADELAGRGIATLILSPGPMDTELLREVVASGHANLRPGQASEPLDVARDLLDRIDAAEPDPAGSWRFRTGEDMQAIANTSVYGH